MSLETILAMNDQQRRTEIVLALAIAWLVVLASLGSASAMRLAVMALVIATSKPALHRPSAETTVLAWLD